jgi:hypothetical protein
MARPAYKSRCSYAVPMTREGVDSLRQLSERFAALGRPVPQRWIIEYALYLLSCEHCLDAPILPISRELLDRRYGTFLRDGGKAAQDAVRQVAAHLERKRIRQENQPGSSEVLAS